MTFFAEHAPAFVKSTCAALALIAVASVARAQTGADPSQLNISSPLECGEVLPQVRGFDSGSQWLIGSDIVVYGTANARSPLGRLQDSFESVVCYSASSVVGDRVFIADPSGEVCAWVDRSVLLDEHPIGERLQARRLICETPRAMPFDAFCGELERLTGSVAEPCVGLPGGLRAKGVLVGSSGEGNLNDYAFMTAPVGGTLRGDRSFFSILELHNIAAGEEGSIMVLAGDGEGDLFGWIDLRALELWPTRLGLFYDAEGTGRMFLSEGDLIRNWRSGAPEPDISAGLGPDALRDYVHGELQLFTYPIVRTIRPDLDPAGGRADDVSYHEVIFFGQSGEGSVTQLVEQAELARRAESLRRLNLMIVIDSTESMRPYLPFVQQGLAAFINDVNRLARDPANRIPETRISVHAYSDFQDETRTGLTDPIVMARLMAPSRIGQFDLSERLLAITRHEGLNDEVGLFSEAAFESVSQLALTFRTDDIWYRNAPSVIIHVADHGSRPELSMQLVADRLTEAGVQYVPLLVTTDDAGQDGRTDARNDLAEQALTIFSRYIDDPVEQDLPRVDLRTVGPGSADAVRSSLNLVLGEVLEAAWTVRSEVLGQGLLTDSQLVRDLASSRIRLDQAFLDANDLGDLSQSVIVRASTAFAPLSRRTGSIVASVDWTYTVALEPQQTGYLRQNFQQLCEKVGAPEQVRALRSLIVDLAETFSGDEIETNEQLRGIMSDLAAMPGAQGSFLAQSPGQLLQMIDSTDPAVITSLRQDVCWTSYHLNNVANGVYARPDQLLWEGRAFVPRPGETVTSRNYRDRPIIGPEIDYLPSFFFVRPSQIEEGQACGFFDDC